MNTIEEFLTPEQVAGLLHVTEKFVHELVRTNRLECIQISPKKRLFTRDQVDRFIVNSTRKAPDKISVDRSPAEIIPSHRKGGEKSTGFSGTDLRKEMGKW